MKRHIILLTALLCVALTTAAHGFTDETLNYKVMFKWGIVHKQAGRATLKLTSAPDHFKATLYARSEPWADHFYTLRDTLISIMDRTDMLPRHYERIAHEDGRFDHDIIRIQRSGDTFTATSHRIRRKKKGAVSHSDITLKAQGPTVDLVSVFYYLRMLDFKNLKSGDSKTINIFSGKRKELLTIKYLGTEELKLDGRTYPTYRISFTFTDEKSAKTSDDIDTWIWTAPGHIPLKLEGKLKVGRIRCLYTGNN
ncbi:DUF3108 domain-containing protein [Paramuribaculum intestinale]|uniref:DUF3108 domain-containing protein n=1 Tax=Paramuribaculum intestinale TaxID=2094151 RepID=UPI0025A9482C|nr:DUF3108 domain-containing protein [Paramuribaculum intestinale]